MQSLLRDVYTLSIKNMTLTDMIVDTRPTLAPVQESNGFSVDRYDDRSLWQATAKAVWSNPRTPTGVADLQRR
jgi:hypothetical protein